MRNAMQQYGVATSLAIDAILVTYLNDWQMLFIIHLSTERKYPSWNRYRFHRLFQQCFYLFVVSTDRR